MPSYQTLLYETRGPVALITLNRPERRNAINRQTLDDLNAALDTAEADEGVRALVLTGAGGAFSSGFDLSETIANDPRGEDAWRPLLRYDLDTVMRLWHCPKPTLSAVAGPAMAGGCELALACDLTIADETAVFGEPEPRFGAGIVVLLLPWLTHPKAAKELLLTGRTDVAAGEAKALGLVNRVVPAGEALTMALTVAAEIAAVDPALAQATKRAINRSYEIMGLVAALEAGHEVNVAVETEQMPTRRAFNEVARADGLKAAIAWREERYADVLQTVLGKPE